MSFEDNNTTVMSDWEKELNFNIPEQEDEGVKAELNEPVYEEPEFKEPANPHKLPFRERIMNREINPIVENTFSSVYEEWHGSPYTFSLNHMTFVVFFDDVTPTKLPKEVMDYFVKNKLPRMTQTARNPQGLDDKGKPKDQIDYIDY